MKARKVLNRKLVEYQMAKLALATEQRELADCQSYQKHVEEALVVARQVALDVQERAHAQIATVVTRSLVSVFDEPYQFKIIFEQKRGKTEARLVFIRNEEEIDPMSAAGGGVVDVAAFALRVSCLLLSRPPARRVLILDEPFRFVSEQYRSRVRQLVEQLSKELKVQFIIVTHMDEFKIGKVVEL